MSMIRLADMFSACVSEEVVITSSHVFNLGQRSPHSFRSGAGSISSVSESCSGQKAVIYSVI